MNPDTSLILADIGDVIAPDDSAKRALTSICISAEQDPDFGVQSGETYEIFSIWIGYRFPFNRIPEPDVQMKSNLAVQKILVWNNSCMRKNYDLSKSYTKNLLV